MKQKRTYVTLLLVLAILGLGIAYAAISTQQLTITGSAQATASSEEIDVVFTEATPTDGTNIKAAVGTADATTATIEVFGLTTAGESAKATYTITNKQTDMAAALNDAIVTFDAIDGSVTESEWFTVTCTKLGGTELTANNEKGTLETASTTVEVTVTLRKTPVTEADQTAAKANIYIEINADPVANATPTQNP